MWTSMDPNIGVASIDFGAGIEAHIGLQYVKVNYSDGSSY